MSASMVPFIGWVAIWPLLLMVTKHSGEKQTNRLGMQSEYCASVIIKISSRLNAVWIGVFTVRFVKNESPRCSPFSMISKRCLYRSKGSAWKVKRSCLVRNMSLFTFVPDGRSKSTSVCCIGFSTMINSVHSKLAAKRNALCSEASVEMRSAASFTL